MSRCGCVGRASGWWDWSARFRVGVVWLRPVAVCVIGGAVAQIMWDNCRGLRQSSGQLWGRKSWLRPVSEPFCLRTVPWYFGSRSNPLGQEFSSHTQPKLSQAQLKAFSSLACTSPLAEEIQGFGHSAFLLSAKLLLSIVEVTYLISL